MGGFDTVVLDHLLGGGQLLRQFLLAPDVDDVIILVCKCLPILDKKFTKPINVRIP